MNKTTIKIYVKCRCCNDGNQKYGESIPNSEGPIVPQETTFKRTEKGGLQEIYIPESSENIHRVSFDLSPEQLGGITIEEFVKNQRCRKCGEQELVELG